MNPLSWATLSVRTRGAALWGIRGSRFATYNFLQEKIPKQEDTLKKLGRNGFIGFCSSVVSDTCSNSIRVVKVYKQVRVMDDDLLAFSHSP